MSEFLQSLVDDMKDEDVSILADGKSSAEFTGYIDTGSYVLNAVLSGSIYDGIPNNKVVGLTGVTSTGKTFIALGVVRYFLETHPDAGVVYYDTESAVTKQMMVERGIDPKRVMIVEPETIEEFQHKATTILNAYTAKKKKDRPPLMFVLDSLGMLSSKKELEGAETGNQKADMGRSQKLLKAAFRTLTAKLAKASVPMIVTGHVYADMGSMYPTNKVAGGSGMLYAASIIAMLGKSQDKDPKTKNLNGIFIRMKMFKSRFTKEGSEVKGKVDFMKGLDRYYGLAELALEAEIWKKTGTQIVVCDGSKRFAKFINDNPEKFYTKDVLDRIDTFTKQRFGYGRLAFDDVGEVGDEVEAKDGVDAEVTDIDETEA